MTGCCILYADLPLGMDGADHDDLCEREVEVAYDVGSTGWGTVDTPALVVTIESAIVCGAVAGDPLDGCGYLLTVGNLDRVREDAETLVRSDGVFADCADIEIRERRRVA